MKKILLCLFLILTIDFFVKAQVIRNITTPLVDGERLLEFEILGLSAEVAQSPPALADTFPRYGVGITSQNQTEILVLSNNKRVYIYYSDRASDLENLSIQNAVPFGIPIVQKKASNVTLNYKFVFPHRSFNMPNDRLYTLSKARAINGLIHYPDIDNSSDVSVGPTAVSTINNYLDGRSRQYNFGTCVNFKIVIKQANTIMFESKVYTFTMPDSYNIAIVGDSYASGEGAPESFDLGNPSEMWRDNNNCPIECHKSRNSGFVQGVKKFISINPEVAVEYVFAACSGAKVEHVFLSAQDKNEFVSFGRAHRIQFDEVKDFLTSRKHERLHQLLMQIGGNNLFFDAYVLRYFVLPFNATQETQMIRSALSEHFQSLRTTYEIFASNISTTFPRCKVAIANYPNPTFGKLGRCGTGTRRLALGMYYFPPEYLCCPLEVSPYTSPVGEYKFTSDEFVDGLNDAVQGAANKFGWTLINVSSKIGIRGICNCDEPYINTLPMSLAVQGDFYGTMHPNALGYEKIYEDPVKETLTKNYAKFRAKELAKIAINKLLGKDDNICSSTTLGIAILQLSKSPNAIQLFRSIQEDQAASKAMRENNNTMLMETKIVKNLVKDTSTLIKHLRQIELSDQQLKVRQPDMKLNEVKNPYMISNERLLNSQEYKRLLRAVSEMTASRVIKLYQDDLLRVYND